jgi:hypothetical protein
LEFTTEKTMESHQTLTEKVILQSFKGFPINLLKIYPRSFSFLNGLMFGLVRTQEGRRLTVMGERGTVLADPFREIFFPARLLL